MSVFSVGEAFSMCRSKFHWLMVNLLCTIYVILCAKICRVKPLYITWFIKKMCGYHFCTFPSNIDLRIHLERAIPCQFIKRLPPDHRHLDSQILKHEYEGEKHIFIYLQSDIPQIWHHIPNPNELLWKEKVSVNNKSEIWDGVHSHFANITFWNSQIYVRVGRHFN